jgi:hypothetical protein
LAPLNIEKPICAVIGSIGESNCKTTGVGLDVPLIGIFVSPFTGLVAIRFGNVASTLKAVLKVNPCVFKLLPQASFNADCQLRYKKYSSPAVSAVLGVIVMIVLEGSRVSVAGTSRKVFAS